MCVLASFHKVEAWKTAGVRNITVRTNVTAGGLRGGGGGAGSGRDTGWGARGVWLDSGFCVATQRAGCKHQGKGRRAALHRGSTLGRSVRGGGLKGDSRSMEDL